jgi:hypothetical protein
MFNAVHIHLERPLKITVCPSVHLRQSVTTVNIPTKSDTGQFYLFSFSHSIWVWNQKNNTVSIKCRSVRIFGWVLCVPEWLCVPESLCVPEWLCVPESLCILENKNRSTKDVQNNQPFYSQNKIFHTFYSFSDDETKITHCNLLDEKSNTLHFLRWLKEVTYSCS